MISNWTHFLRLFTMLFENNQHITYMQNCIFWNWSSPQTKHLDPSLYSSLVYCMHREHAVARSTLQVIHIFAYQILVLWTQTIYNGWRTNNSFISFIYGPVCCCAKYTTRLPPSDSASGNLYWRQVEGNNAVMAQLLHIQTCATAHAHTHTHKKGRNLIFSGTLINNYLLFSGAVGGGVCVRGTRHASLYAGLRISPHYLVTLCLEV